MHMQQSGQSAKIEEVSKFYHPARNAKFYFSKQLSESLVSYFNLCFTVADAARVDNKTTRERGDVAQSIQHARDLAISIEHQLVKKLTLS